MFGPEISDCEASRYAEELNASSVLRSTPTAAVSSGTSTAAEMLKVVISRRDLTHEEFKKELSKVNHVHAINLTASRETLDQQHREEIFQKETKIKQFELQIQSMRQELAQKQREISGKHQRVAQLATANHQLQQQVAYLGNKQKPPMLSKAATQTESTEGAEIESLKKQISSLQSAVRNRTAESTVEKATAAGVAAVTKARYEATLGRLERKTLREQASSTAALAIKLGVASGVAAVTKARCEAKHEKIKKAELNEAKVALTAAKAAAQSANGLIKGHPQVNGHGKSNGNGNGKVAAAKAVAQAAMLAITQAEILETKVLDKINYPRKPMYSGNFFQVPDNRDVRKGDFSRLASAPRSIWSKQEDDSGRYSKSKFAGSKLAAKKVLEKCRRRPAR